MVLRQSCGGSSAGTGISSVTISGCLNGSGIPSSPLSLKIDPTGLIGCGAAGLKLLNAPSGGSGGTPASPVNSIQFNNGGSFGGSSGLMWNSTGVTISSLATTGTFFSVGRSADSTSAFEVAQYVDFISARHTTVRGEGLYVGQDSTSNRVGLIGQFGFRVASDLSYGFSDSTSGVATLDLALFKDASDTLAQRRTTNAQKFSIYKTYTSASNYERGVIDWKGSPGVLRIGTEQAGAGVANPVQLITSGAPRIEISTLGSIQFNQVYTFPTGVGASGLTLVNNGAGFLNWGTPYVFSSGCVTGSGTIVSPLQVQLDPTGLIVCGVNGLRYNGPTGSMGGLPAAPNQSIQFNDGGVFGGSTRLTWNATTVGVSGNINISGATLGSDSAHILAQRDGSNAQGIRIYNTYTNAASYERGVFDWIGSPGVLQIGTQHAGGGTAKGVQLITSGVPRIDIQPAGAIQFYGAYTFPSTNGISGQVLTTNGVGALNWTVPTGAGAPASPVNSIQFNNAGSFGGSANLTWDGTNLQLIGGGIQIDGTSNLYPMLTNSTSTTNEMQIRLADDSDLANLRVNFMHIGGVSGIRLNAAGSGIGVITNNLGLDFQRFCFGGSTNLFPALKKVGTALEARLADDTAYTTLRCATLNLSTDIALERDAADTLAQRRSTNAQKLSVYNTYTSSVDYERAVIDFKGSPGVLRIGTEQQGLGVANPIDIITSGTPRISISALGNIQFNQAYTFPTGVGSSGQTFINNGTSTLIWGLPSVRATGCLVGSGTLVTPLQILINPTGFLHCTPLGLAYNGPTGVGGGSTLPASPVNSIQFNNAGSFGGSSNLTWDGSCVMISGITTSGAPVLNVAQKWYGPASTSYSGVIFNFIDPSSASSTSKMLDLQIGGTSKTYFDKTGTLYIPGAPTTGYNAIFLAGTNYGIGYYDGVPGLTIGNTNAHAMYVTQNDVRITSTVSLGWSSSGWSGSADVKLNRDAPDSLGMRNSNASQRINIYKNYDSDSAYQRGVLDWQTTSGTLRIGTEQAGTGNIATPLSIITSGTPRISIAASGAITFNQAYTFPTDLGASGQVLRNHGGGLIKWGNVSGGGVTSLSLNLTGGGTHADPTTAVNLVYNNSSGFNTIDFRPLVYFNFGQAGSLSAEGAITDQPRFIVPEGFQLEICKAYLTIGSPGDDTTTVQLQRYVATTDCTEPGTNGTPFSKDITGGCTWVQWTEVEGLVLDSLSQLNFRVLTAGTSAMNLVAHFWVRATVCYAP